MASNLAVYGIYEYLQTAANFATLTVTDSTATGSGSGSYPASNILTKRLGQYYQRTGLAGATPGTVILDVRIQGATGAPVPATFGLMALLNVQCFFDSGTKSGQAIACNVRIRGSNTAFTSGYLTGYDYNRSIYPDPGLPKNAWWVPSYTGADLTTSGEQQYGGSPPPGYIRIEITLQAATTDTFTVRVGRLCAWLALFCNAKLQWGYQGIDDSDITRSYDGTPYALTRSPRRRITGTLQQLTDAMVFGESVYLGTANGMMVPNLAVANALSGISREVALLPRMDLSQAAITGVKYPTIWQSMPIFGLNNAPFRASLESKAGGTNFWTSDFQIDEIVP